MARHRLQHSCNGNMKRIHSEVVTTRSQHQQRGLRQNRPKNLKQQAEAKLQAARPPNVGSVIRSHRGPKKGRKSKAALEGDESFSPVASKKKRIHSRQIIKADAQMQTDDQSHFHRRQMPHAAMLEMQLDANLRPASYDTSQKKMCVCVCVCVWLFVYLSYRKRFFVQNG